LTPVFEAEDKRAVAHISEGKGPEKDEDDDAGSYLFNKAKKAQSLLLCAFSEN
jgi:hypothetical protein